MQKQIIIKTKDKQNNIYGVLDYQTKKDKLIIFVHGLTGHKNEHQFYNASKYFTTKNFAVFRFDLYSGATERLSFGQVDFPITLNSS